MTTAPAIHCVHCPLPVHPTRGGAYCEVHTPVDLTGGVDPSAGRGRRLVLGQRGAQPGRGRPTAVAEETVTQWVEAYTAGMTFYAIGQRWGAADSTVRYHVMRRGVPMRPRGAQPAAAPVAAS